MKIPKELAEQVEQRLMTGREAAAILKITETTFCKLLKKQNIKRIPGITATEREANRIRYESRRAHRKALAAQVRAHSKTIAQAAKEANCSQRTIYRYL